MRRTVYRVAVADDHPLYRSAIAELLGRTIDFEVVCSVPDLNHLIDFLEKNSCDLAILDVVLPGTDGIAGARLIRARWPEIKVALISGDLHAGVVAEALGIGVTGFFPKSFNPDVILAATRLVMTGAIYIPHGLAGATADAEPRTERPPTNGGALTDREREVLGRMACGRTYKEIARELELAEVTVKLHAQRIARKLGARNRAEAIARAVKDRLIEGPG